MLLSTNEWFFHHFFGVLILEQTWTNRILKVSGHLKNQHNKTFIASSQKWEADMKPYIFQVLKTNDSDSSMKQKKMNVKQRCKCCSLGPVSETFEFVKWFLCSMLNCLYIAFWIYNQCNRWGKDEWVIHGGTFHFVGLQLKNSKDEILWLFF